MATFLAAARLSWARVSLLAGSILLLAGCATVPATGQKQLSFFSEQEEIDMGREADAEIVASVGLYDDAKVQEYVAGVGAALAADSERPNLPWSFQVLDDETVNAFALPGGWIYVTRGILTHLSSESELAAVLGHEIGHVTARHGVHELSKQLLVTAGLGLAVLLDSKLETAAAVSALALNVLFLKFGRNDERQADDLGLRYLVRSGYDPRPMPEVFAVLQGVEKIEGTGRLPNWLSTHPDPGARRERIEKEIGALNADFSGQPSRREAYLRKLDGMVFGSDPRNGFFQDNLFLHPGLAFRFEFPANWETLNQQSAVSASEPNGQAEVQVSLAEGAATKDAVETFFAQEGIERGESWTRQVHGNPASWHRFEATVEEQQFAGTVAFVRYQGKIFQLLAYGLADSWPQFEDDLEQSLASFNRLTDRAALNVQPRRIQLVTLKESTTIERFAERQPSTVDLPTLTLINHAQAGENLAAGRLMKRIVGPPPPGTP